ncbi:MAG: cytochrome c3 family protein [Anaerolineae bacterium]
MKTYFWFAIAGILLVAAGFTLISTDTAFAQDATTEPAPEPIVQSVIENPPYLADYYNAWVSSGHADTTAEAFNHWNDEGVVEADCAKCHSTPGYVDFLGGDGSEVGVVNNEAIPVGSTVTCDACHNPAASSLQSVTFPSGLTVTTDGNAARCMVCHQGRSSTPQVNAALESNGATADMNAVNPDIRFINIHYYPAAAALYGTEAKGGYEYEGNRYEVQNEHVEGVNTCDSCHNPHTLEIRLDVCQTCHEDVETVDDLKDIRMNGSLVDYNGNGDDFEGIYYEIAGLQELLYQAIQAYATDVAGSPIVYKVDAYPYFFADANGNGEVDEGESGYASFTGNLLTAAYNYQMSMKDPGNFAHNPQYYIHLLYDSITTLNENMPNPVDMQYTNRNSHGHFDTTGEPFRHWDGEGEVPGTCAKCHTASGLPTFIANGTNIAVEPSPSLQCTTCHDAIPDFTTYQVDTVTFPSGAKVSFGEGEPANLCITCHQGRESTVSVNRAIGNLGDDEVSDTLAFRNVHYFAAGATLFGTDVKGAYEFADHEYNGRNIHVVDEVQVCTDCHDVHRQTLDLETCQDCHEDVETVEDVRLIRSGEGFEGEAVDYNGNGDAEEPMRDEIATFEEALLAGLQAYATNTVGTSIAYSPAAYPYFFIDTNGNGVVDEDEATNDNKYVTWTPTLLRAAYNYQYFQKDPGDYAHNPRYAMQVLYDSIAAVGGDVSNFTRPDVTAAQS